MRNKKSNMISWILTGMTLLFSASAYAVNEMGGVDVQKLLSTKDVTLYIYIGQFVDMNEENFYKKSCIYKTADRDRVLALVQLINFSRLKKNELIMARPSGSEVNEDVWKSKYAVKLNFSDNTSAWMMLEAESMGGDMDGYYTYLPDYDRFPIIGPDLLGNSLRMWTQLLPTQPAVTANSTNTVEQCDKVITKSVFMK